MGSVEAMQPSRPTHLSLYAEACLRSLVANELGDRISLGGAFGLLHYLDYRPTHDVDAWWVVSATAQERQRVIDTITTTLESFGQVRTRAWGDVVSVELSQEGRVAFSFQIASRSAQLEPPSFAPWADVLLDSFGTVP